MEENNLNVAPTQQELYNAGFEDSHFGIIEFNLDNNNTTIVADTEKGGFRFIGSSTWLLLTKQKINDVFALFNKPLPQWEKPKPKVGEVWKNSTTVYLINNTVLKATSRVTIVSDNDLETGTIVHIVYYGLAKVADSLEDYYKEKFLKNCTDWAKKNEELDDKLKQQESQVEESYIVHQYSYKGLKAKGKIPHDRSGEDHDSIEAFKKLLAICESLNGMFKPNINGNIYAPYYDNGLDWKILLQHFESPIYFTSKEAFEAFKSAPENVELFKTFLKIK